MKLSLISILLLSSLSFSAQAFVPLDGYVIALERCEAYQSKNALTNPGDRFTEPMRAYVVRGMNQPVGDFYQIIDPGAPVTADRWVHVSCGVHVVDAMTETALTDNDGGGTDSGDGGSDGGGDDGTDGGTDGGGDGSSEESTDNLLALSWQPAFCETRPGKKECLDLNEGNLPITEQQLSIHGLWAQPRNNTYCDVSDSDISLDTSGQWHLLPAPELSAETRERLDVAMPGTASQLERHEWIKHGTCHRGAGGAEEYFSDTLRVTQAINESVVASYLAEHVGASVDTAVIRQKFDEAFGNGAGDRVQFHCKGDQGRVLLQEITINLKGRIDSENTVAELMLAGDLTSLGCPSAVIDASGLQ